MGRNKKPRKAYRPGPAYAVSPEQYLRPMPDGERERLLAVFRSAVQAMAACQHPGPEEWRDLADAINTVETLATVMHEISETDAEPILEAAKDAMDAAADRWHRGQGMRLDARGLEAIRSTLDIYEACAQTLTGATMARAGKLTAERLRKAMISYREGVTVVIA